MHEIKNYWNNMMNNKIQFKIILTGKLTDTDGAISEMDLVVEGPIETALKTFKNTFYFSVDSLLKQFGDKLTVKYNELIEAKQKVIENEKRKDDSGTKPGETGNIVPAPTVQTV